MTWKGRRFDPNMRNARFTAISANASDQAILPIVMTDDIPSISLSPIH